MHCGCAYLLCVTSTHCWFDLSKALADEQGSVDEHAVGRSVDLEVAKEYIGPEERQDLVHAVVGLAVRGNINIRGVCGECGQGVSGTTCASAQRQDWEVP